MKRIGLFFLVWVGSSFADVLPAREIPASLMKCAELIREAEKVPVEKIDPVGNSLPGISRGKGLSSFIALRRAALEQTAIALKSLERSEGEWGDDAAVLLGFLYSVTCGQETWAQSTAFDQYRALVHLSNPVRLDAWTLGEILGSPRNAYAWRERKESDSAKIARIFARELVLYTHLQAGTEAAEQELATLRSAPNLSPEVIIELSTILSVVDERLEESPK